MMTDWTFLEPWRAALCASVIEDKPVDSGNKMQVSFKSFLPGEFNILPLMLHLEEEIPQNVDKVIRIREAMELFTVLFTVDTKAFEKQFPQSTRHSEQNWRPEWNLHICGAASVQHATWSSLIKFLEPTRQFQQAMHKLEAMRLGIGADLSCNGVTWECQLAGANVHASLKYETESALNEIKTDLRRLFNGGVLLIAQLGLPADGTALVDIWQDLRQQVPMNVRIAIKIHDLTTTTSRNLAAGLVRTPINSLSIEFDQHNRTKDPQATINAGFLLHRVYEWSQVSSGYTVLMCTNVSKGVLAAICSTVATIPVDFIMHIHYVDSESWPWLVYAVSCTPASEMSLTIWFSTLETSDISSVSKVVRYRFPFSKDHESLSIIYDASEFGYVDIVEGTTLWLVNDEDGQAVAFVVPASVRCRTWSKDRYLEVVVPGFGLCRTRLESGVSEVALESEEENSQVLSSAFRSFIGYFVSSESALVLNLLELIGGYLRDLRLCTFPDSNDVTLDLSVLSAACPNLESLDAYHFDVVVSVHNESLRLWPIKELHIHGNTKLADLTSCLRNPDLRMTRELLKLYLGPMVQECDEKMNLSVHNGDFLNVTKEKVPIKSKAAMMSVITRAHHLNARHRLHDDVLGLIFVFASTPAQRLLLL